MTSADYKTKLTLFNTLWDRRKIPDDWNKDVIIKIPKKGALSDCNNWRGVTLLSTPSKILAKVIMKRLSLAVAHRLCDEQAGFRRGRGCIDHIFTLRNIIEQSTKWQRTLYVNFVDFAKAFDSVHRHSLWKLLRAYGIPPPPTLLRSSKASVTSYLKFTLVSDRGV